MSAESPCFVLIEKFLDYLSNHEGFYVTALIRLFLICFFGLKKVDDNLD